MKDATVESRARVAEFEAPFQALLVKFEDIRGFL
jgi:hypothetical protein